MSSDQFPSNAPKDVAFSTLGTDLAFNIPLWLWC